MTREEFRTGTFERDAYTCCVPGCEKEAVDPHHIIERKLWDKTDPYPEGYHPHNGASLCEEHHRLAENNAVPPQALRRWLGIPTVLPIQLNPAHIWDKWGGEIPRLPNNKYPSTPYLPFSPQIDAADETADVKDFLDRALVVSVKLDGANVSLTREKVAARNGDSASHPQFDRLKALHSGFRQGIPEGVIVFAEWLYAKHSIHYTDLTAYLQVISVYYPEHQLIASVAETKELADKLGLEGVPLLLSGMYGEEWRLQGDLFRHFQEAVGQGHEGIVVRNAYPFHTGRFAKNIAKMVREDHNTCDDWKSKPITPNRLK